LNRVIIRVGYSGLPPLKISHAVIAKGCQVGNKISNDSTAVNTYVHWVVLAKVYYPGQ